MDSVFLKSMLTWNLGICLSWRELQLPFNAYVKITPAPVNMDLFGDRIFADKNSEEKVIWITVGSNP